LLERRWIVACALDTNRVGGDARTGGLAPLAAGGCRERHGDERRSGGQATHCHRAHCTVVTPRKRALSERIAVCNLGRPPATEASARKNGKSTSPNRGIERSGQRLLGTLSGTARLTAQNRPYGVPNRRQTTTVSAT